MKEQCLPKIKFANKSKTINSFPADLFGLLQAVFNCFTNCIPQHAIVLESCSVFKPSEDSGSL